MGYWFYQLNQQRWPPERFRIEVWENERWSWTVGRAVLEGEEPKPGDSVAFFYAKAKGSDPGFFGWAIILEWYRDHDGNRHISFRPVAPTNYLKMYPWWNDEAQRLSGEIRAAVKQGTFWWVSEEQWKRIRRGVAHWVNGRGSEEKGPGATSRD